MRELVRGPNWLIACLCGMLVGTGCSRMMCGQDLVKSEETSPDGKYVAGVLERNCGATTQYADFVAIRPVNSRWDSDAVDRAVLLVVDQTPITAFWRKDGTLIVRITREGAGKVIRRKDSFEGIPVKHVIQAETAPAAGQAP